MAPEAKRRDTPGEMPGVQHVTEADDHFVVTFADGKSTTVTKDGLKADTLAHIQGMAHGGEVAGLAGGTGTVDPDAGAGDPSLPHIAPLPTVFKLGTTGSGEVSAGDTTTDAPPRVAQTQGEEIPSFADGGVVGAPDGGFGATQFFPVDPATGLPDPFASVNPAAMDATVQVTAGAPAPPTDLAASLRQSPVAQSLLLGPVGAAMIPDESKPRGMIAPGTPAQMEATKPQRPPDAPMAGAQSPGFELPPYRGSGAMGELNKGVDEQRAAFAAQADVERQRDEVLLQLADTHIAKMQALESEHAEQYAATQRRAEDLFQATLNARIDPNRVWAHADIGQRVGAGIGILLSGIGQGLAGGPNLALAQIDKTIDRDIDAQKANLETQKGLLSYYLQQGRDMLSAHQLAKADLKDMLAAQLTRVSAEFGGPEAAARAQLASGQLRTETAKTREAIFSSDYARKRDRMAMELDMERARVMGQFTQQLDAGRDISAGVWELMPKDVRERRVRLPSGGWGLAKDAQQATKLGEGLEKVDEFKRVLAGYTRLHQSGSPRVASGVGGDETAAQQIRATLQALLKEAEALGAMSKGDYDFIDRQIPDISSWTTRDVSMEQGLRELGGSVDARVAARLKTLGLH